MRETYTLDEIKEKLEHEKYLRKENQELYEELQVLRKCSDGTNDLANEYKKRIDKAIEYIEENQEEHKYTDRGGFTYTEGHFLRDSDTLLEILDKE